MSNLLDTYLYAAVRTPFGKFNGSLASVRPDDLAAHVLQALLERAPQLDPAAVGEVYLGNANGAGEDNRNVGRMAWLLAGYPVETPATSINRLCGSSLDAAIQASRALASGDLGADGIAVAGGVESMTRAPWVLPKSDRPFPAGDVTAVSTTLGWRLVNPKMPAEWTVSLGEANEQLQERFSISRERQDEFAARSHRLAAAAWEDGFYDALVTPVKVATRKASTVVDRDEGIRPETTVDTLAGLRPAFRPDGTITAGNASPLSDGAGALLLGTAAAAGRIGTDPLARIAGRAASALEPQSFGFAPVEAANHALAQAGISWSDVGAVEVNEAFAVQSLACVDAWSQLGLRDADIVNTRGGAIALGHPLGASGTRILGTLAAVLRERGERWGVAAICIGVGQALAVVLENTDLEGAAA